MNGIRSRAAQPAIIGDCEVHRVITRCVVRVGRVLVVGTLSISKDPAVRYDRFVPVRIGAGIRKVQLMSVYVMEPIAAIGARIGSFTVWLSVSLLGAKPLAPWRRP